VSASVLAHLVTVGVFLTIGRGALAPLPDIAADASATPLTISIAPVEVAEPLLAAADPGDPPLTDLTLPYDRPLNAPEADRDNPVPVTVAPSVSDEARRVVPAPDEGNHGGAPAEHAFRRDSSTLRSRLTDGAAAFQPAHTATARRAASPQAIRRERTVGIGDSLRTRTPTRAPDPAPRPAATVALAADATGASPPASTAPAAPDMDAPAAATRVAQQPDPARGTGSLDAEQGARAFDVDARGRAADDQTLRASSSETRPGITDFTRPSASAPAPTPGGRGPGDAPGAVDRPSIGSSPSAPGAPNPRIAGPDVEQRSIDRRYDRYYLEIQRRVNRVLEFPKPLALRLEQGETIVYFVVGVDGRLGEGPRVVKSSGFEEFDSAAMRAVRQAAPFPPMTDPRTARPRPMSMSVTFDNPVIR